MLATHSPAPALSVMADMLRRRRPADPLLDRPTVFSCTAHFSSDSRACQADGDVHQHIEACRRRSRVNGLYRSPCSAAATAD